MIDRKDLKGMIRALKKGEVVWYAPDHDYGPAASVFVPFSPLTVLRRPAPGCWQDVKACIVPSARAVTRR